MTAEALAAVLFVAAYCAALWWIVTRYEERPR